MLSIGNAKQGNFDSQQYSGKNHASSNRLTSLFQQTLRGTSLLGIFGLLCRGVLGASEEPDKVQVGRRLLSTGISVINPTPDQFSQPDVPYSLSFNAKHIFSQVDNQTLHLSIEQSSGAPAPSWLNIDMRSTITDTTMPDSGQIYIHDGYLFHHWSTGYKLYELTSLTHPTPLGIWLNGDGYILDIIIEEDIGYFAFAQYDFYTFNVSNPLSPLKLKRVGFSEFGFRLVKKGSTAYCGTLQYNLDDGLKVIDVSDPHNPILANSVDTTGADIRGLDISGNYLLTAQEMNGLVIYDISNPLDPVIAGSSDPGGNAQDVKVKGNYAFTGFTKIPYNGFRVFDISTITAPTSVFFSQIGDCSLLEIHDNYLFLSSDGLHIYNIQDPVNPTFLQLIQLPISVQHLYPPNHPFSDSFLAGSATGVKLIDISNWEIHGTPSPSDTGIIELNIIAEDGDLNRAEDTFQLQIGGPLVSIPLLDQTTNIGSSFSYIFPANAFEHSASASLTYSATLAGGSPLPSWLTFTAGTRTFSGTPLSGDQALSNILVTATDPFTLFATDLFTLDVVNRAPYVNVPLEPVAVNVGAAFNTHIPSSTFIDPDLDTLAYSATLEGGAPFPSWLTFDTDTKTFSGKAPDPQTLHFTVQAEDGHGGVGIDSFVLSFIDPNNCPPVALNPLSNQIAKVGQPFSLVIPIDTFNDPNGDALELEAALVGGAPLPGWLDFDPQTRTLSGTPSRSDTNHFSDEVLSIETKANDGVGSAASSFTLSVSGESVAELALKFAGPSAGGAIVVYGAYTQRALLFNHWKKERYQREPIKIGVGNTLNHSFTHPKEQIARVRVLFNGKSLPGGIDLPNWLNYNHYHNTLIGTPESYAVGTLTVQIIDKNKFILEEFDLIVAEMNMKNGLAILSSKEDLGTAQVGMEPLVTDNV